MALTVEQMNDLMAEITLGKPSGLSGVVNGVDIDALKAKLAAEIADMKEKGIAADTVRP